jgi:hypothetical protein
MNFVEHKKRSSLGKVVGLSVTVLLASILLVPQSLIAATAPTPSTPTLVWPQDLSNSITEEPVIKGLTQNNTEVEVFIDGQLNGMANVKNGAEATASFAYTPFLPLKSGNHTVSARAINNVGQKSELSEVTTFVIEEPYPAPSLFQPVVNDKTVSTKPFIVGVAVNDSLVKVFIDGKLDGQFKVENSTSGTADFAYQPFLELDPAKEHLVYATATGSNGKESAYSNVVGFNVTAPKAELVEEDPLVLGVSDVQEVAAATEEETTTTEEESTTEEEATTDEEATDEDSEEEGEESEEEEGATEEDSEESRSTAIWWVILVIVIIIVVINLRGRGGKDNQGGLKGLEELGKKDDDSSGKPGSDSNSEQQTLLKKEESKENQGGNKDMPPPPPSK